MMKKMGFRDLGDLYSQDLSARFRDGGFPTVATRADPINALNDSRPKTMTMKLMSETVQRDPEDTYPVSTQVGQNDILDGLRRQRAELTVEKAAEAAEGEPDAQEMDRAVLADILSENPQLVFEALISFLEGRTNQSME